MEKKQIEEAYKIAYEHWLKNTEYPPHPADIAKDYVNIGIQMALNKEVLLDDNSNVIIID